MASRSAHTHVNSSYMLQSNDNIRGSSNHDLRNSPPILAGIVKRIFIRYFLSFN